MRKKLFSILFAILVFTALTQPVSANQCNSLDSLSWLLGDWVSLGESKSISENWERLGAHTFEGSGETRSNTDNQLLEQESLRLLEMSGEIFYLAKVSHNAFPVPFKLGACSANSAVFENPAHDFPKRLEYRLTNPNSLSVSVSGSQGKGFTLHFSRAR